MSPFDSSVRYAPIPWAAGYLFGDDGSTWSCRTLNGKGPYPAPWRRILGYPDPKGYIRVRLSIEGRSRSFGLHRLILEAFVGPCPSGMEACHGDGNPANNASENLRWDTPAGNSSDRKRIGSQIQGQTVGSSKLTDEQVREIRDLRQQGWTFRKIRLRFGVSHTTVHNVVSLRTWRHVS